VTDTCTLAVPAVHLPPCAPFVQRILKHPRVMHYNRLVALVLVGNIAVAVSGVFVADWWTPNGADLRAFAMAAQANLAVAVLVRQQYVINALAWLVTRPPTSWPLRTRWMLGKYYHFGGVHVGSAVAGTLWYLALVVSLLHDAITGVGQVSNAHVIVATIVTAFAVMIVMALPRLRAAQHDRFEVTHRFCGWVALVLEWARVTNSSSPAMCSTAPVVCSLERPAAVAPR
jgi:hypothetical protein